nr:MAG TPA: hypothetical protein [Caudoviricetes sp.]
MSVGDTIHHAIIFVKYKVLKQVFLKYTKTYNKI